ncbi:MAG: hypothetical protein BroJett018_47070 [Chloroflexota bacterium]|nr:hypothetical protein [Chloroflexota bacterium]NOG64331.1 hypothetical protein [Chloroflexota bacterium]GIK66913.1 MAG: hypothetical protein BroJett018_47070 [Chloroflexota bacterium]
METHWRKLVLLPLLLMAVLLNFSHQNTRAQDSDEFWRTTVETAARECPQLTCAELWLLPAQGPITVQTTVEGDAVSDITTWLEIVHPLLGTTGYVNLSEAEQYTPEEWQTYPVLPVISDTAREIYQKGLEMGNDPTHFSVVGDCQNVEWFFLGVFDRPDEYALGQFDYLQPTIDHFAGSWSRRAATVDNGYNVASVLSAMWADPEKCQAGETPLDCEFRLHRPSIVLISMETWWNDEPADEYETYLRQIVEFWISNGAVPILATKADNLEGDNGINQAIVRVANDYDIPLWNFWLAVQPLPLHGLTIDNFHLTFARNFFDDPDRLRNAWPVRNLTALQAIDVVWKGVQVEE